MRPADHKTPRAMTVIDQELYFFFSWIQTLKFVSIQFNLDSIFHSISGYIFWIEFVSITLLIIFFLQSFHYF